MDSLYDKINKNIINYKSELSILNKKIDSHKSIIQKNDTIIQNYDSILNKYNEDKKANNVNISKIEKKIKYYNTFVKNVNTNNGKINNIIENLI